MLVRILKDHALAWS